MFTNVHQLNLTQFPKVFWAEMAKGFLKMNLTLQLSMLHAASYHWIQTYSGGFEKIKEDFALFFHNDGWISHGTEEMKAQFEVSGALRLTIKVSSYGQSANKRKMETLSTATDSYLRRRFIVDFNAL